MTVRDHVLEFLAPIGPRYSVRSVGKNLLEAAEADESIAAKLDAIQKKIGDGGPLIDNEHSAIYERIKYPGAIPDIPMAPEWLRPLIAVGYLRAKANLSATRRTRLYGHWEEALEKVLKLLDTLEPTFLGELLVETVLTAREDREFAQFLSDGAAEYRALVDELYGPATETVAFAKTQPGRGARGGSCTCSRTINGQTQYEPCSCWLIVVIVVVIIVTK